MSTKPSTTMVDLRSFLNKKSTKISLPILLGIAFAVIITLLNSDDWLKLEMKIRRMDVETRFNEPPVYIGSLSPSADKDMKPYALCSTENYYLVSYLNQATVDILDKRFKRLQRLDLSHNGVGAITGLSADEDHIYAADSQTGDIRIYNYSGELIRRIAWLPDNKTRLRPHGLTLFDGVLYVTDRKLQKLLAINIMPKPGISEPGELLFAVPGAQYSALEFLAPAFCGIAPDGRLLVSTMEPPNIHIFTCNGRYMGPMIKPGNNQLKSPQGIAFDPIPSPELMARADSIFDPSGVYNQGRIHVADRETGRIHVYDTFGKPVITYGKELLTPIHLVIDNKRRIIVISDVTDAQLKIYKF